MEAATLEAVRAFVQRLAREGATALLPSAIEQEFSVSTDEALAWLLAMQQEQLVSMCAYINCWNCEESHCLKGRTLPAVESELNELLKRGCPRCHHEYPSREEVRLWLTFFCARIAARPGAVGAGLGAPSRETSVSAGSASGREFSIDDLRRAGRRASIMIGDGATVNIVHAGGDAAIGGMAKAQARGTGSALANAGRGAERPKARDDDAKCWHRHPVVWAAVITAGLGLVGTVIQSCQPSTP